MPRLRTRFAGILFASVVALLLAGCGSTPLAGTSGSPSPTSTPIAGSRSPSPSPTPELGPPAAAQDLAISGDVSGTMTTLSAQSAETPSACTERPVQSAAWSSTLYGTIDGSVYGFEATVKPYNGPGTYTAAQAQIQLFSATDKDKVWESLPGDKVSFTVHDDNLTGTVEATLTNLGSNQATLQINGTWSCAP